MQQDSEEMDTFRTDVGAISNAVRFKEKQINRMRCLFSRCELELPS
jgi:hypothetical protein